MDSTAVPVSPSGHRFTATARHARRSGPHLASLSETALARAAVALGSGVTETRDVRDRGWSGAVEPEEVTISGGVTALWAPSHPSIAQVGLADDESGPTKFTAWQKSRVATVEVGDRVRIRHVAKNWYDGRVSVALTGWSSVIPVED